MKNMLVLREWKDEKDLYRLSADMDGALVFRVYKQHVDDFGNKSYRQLACFGSANEPEIKSLLFSIYGSQIQTAKRNDTPAPNNET